MLELLFLLLPIAAVSGYVLGKKFTTDKLSKTQGKFSTQYFTGLNYLLNEQPDKAVDFFIEMLDVDDETIETHFTLGSLFRKRGEIDKAIRIHQGLIARASLTKEQRSLALLELARNYVYAGVLDRAEKLLLDLVFSGEQLVPSLTHLSEIYQKERQWEKAINITQRLQTILGGDLVYQIAQFYCELAEQAIKLDNVKEATMRLKQALRENKNCVRASIMQGDLAQRQQDYRAADKAYQRAQQQDPKFMAYQTLQKANYRCKFCGFYTQVLTWQCPSCRNWEGIKLENN